MPRYAPVASSPSSPTSATRRSSFASLRRSSLSSFRFASARDTPLPDPDEMDAAFDGPEDEHEGETHGLLAQSGREPTGRIPGDYDFERDYTLPPSSPPPFQPYSAINPAPGNTNGEVPTEPVRRPDVRHGRYFLGGILPISFLPRQNNPLPASRVVGAGNSGIFGNLAARPNAQESDTERREGPEWVSEEEQKEGPPSYQAALRDAVPPYWDTTVVLPSSSSPFGPLSSSMSGDEILIDGMPTGNFFGFFWNLIVSVSFQFVGFLLTYVLHTTHAAKYGSRVGLGITLIQFGLGLRSRAEELINTGEFPPADPNATDPPEGNAEEIAAENAISTFWGPGSPWPATIKDPLFPEDHPPTVIHNMHEAELYAHAHNQTLTQLLNIPSAQDVGRANEWFSFMLMSVGWFLVLTSLGGWWRVKRFEAGLKRAQRESEAAQAEAAAQRGEGEEAEPTIATSTTTREDGPLSLGYYTSAFSQAFAGARDLQRGFFGMRGSPIGGERGGGHAPLPTDEHELLDAQGFGLEPMAGDSGERRGRGLWGV